MSAEVTDVSSIQDEELLRRMWQQTEDFGRKKEIRARMYKLREQRLKEFYTTGEVLSDVLSTSTSSLDEGRRNVNSSNLQSSQSSSQIITKSSYASSSSGSGYNITHADSLADEGFLTLKTKEIRDSESPTREFHQRQEKNAKNESSSPSASAGGGYWRIAQESSSGGYESTCTTGEGGEMIIHTTSRNESRNLAADSKNEGFTTATQATSSEHTQRKPQPDSGSQLDETGDKSVIPTSSREDTGARNVASSAQICSENLSSTSSASYSASRSQQYQQSEEISAVTSSTAMSHEHSQAVSGSEGTIATVSESTKFSSPTSATQDVISSSTTASTQINNTQTSKHRITQRSQTGELVSKTIQSTSGSSDIKSPTTNQPSGTVKVTSSSLMEDSSRSSTKISDQHTMNELHNLDSIVCTQGMAIAATPVDLADTRDSTKWTVVSSDKIQNVNNATDEFVLCSGHTTEDKKDSTTKHDTKFIEQERTSFVVNRHDIREPEEATPRKADEKTSTITNKDKAHLQSLISEVAETPKRGVPTQDTTIGKDGTNTTGQYVTTYQEAYTKKRISVDLSPTHEAFARSLRASPERATPPSSTRSSSKASLDHPSPDRFNKSPTRSYRNKTSPDNTLASGRTSPDKTPRSKTPPVRATAEKITNKASPRHSSPEKTPAHRSPLSRVSPEKTSRHPDGTSPSRLSPEKLTQSPYSHRKESPEKTGKSSSTDTRKTSEIATKISEKDGSPSVASPDKITRPTHAETTHSLKTYTESQQQDKPSNASERNFSCSDKPHDISSNVATRKTSDSTKMYSSVSNRDSAVKAKTTKDKRKLSSGLSRATNKKRSSTPGVSPSSSPTRDDEARLYERQSRPRSRGTPSRSSSDSEDHDSNVKSQKLENEFEEVDNVSKTIVQTTTTDSEANTKRTEFGKTNIESYTTDEKIATASSSETDKRTGGQTPKGKQTVADSSPRKNGEPREFVPEDSKLERVKTKSPLLSSIDRASDKCSNVTSLTTEVTSEGAINVKKIKSAGSASVSAKTSKNKSPERDSYGITERSTSPQKIMPDDVGTNVLPRSQESSNSSPSSSPNAVSPTTHSASSKRVMDRLPREKSPEYSSEGSLVNELYLKRSTTDVAREVTSPVKIPRDVRKDSPDSSPDRESFKPIKCFRTSPEIRPSTLEFAHPGKHAPFKASPEKIKSPTKSFKSKTVDDATTNLKSVIGEDGNPLRQPTTRGEPIFFTNADLKMSPKRPNASPAFENDDLRAPSTKIEVDIFNIVPLAAKDTSPDATKENIGEIEYERNQTTEYASAKRAPDDQTRIYHEDLGTTITNGTSEKVLSEYVSEKPSKLPKKAEKETSQDVYDENEQLQDSARKSITQDSDVDKTFVQQCTESKSSNISPRSSSPEKSSATRIAKITVKLTSPVKKYSPQDKKAKSTGNTPSSSKEILSSSQQYQSDSSPERDFLKGRKVPIRSHPEKSDDTEPSKHTCVSNRIPNTSATPDKSIRKKLDRSVPLPSQSPESPKLVSQPSREKPTSKVLESKSGDQIPTRDHSAAQTPKRASRKASPSPHSSPERTSPNKTVRPKYDSSPDSRQSPTPSPERINEREIHPKAVAKSPKRLPSPSPERHRSAEKKSPAVKPSPKRFSALPEHYSPSSSPEKRSRIPGRCIRGSPNQSPARSSEPTAKYNQNISRPDQSPVYPVQKTRPNYSPARTKQSPARPSEQKTRINEAPARVIQSRAHSSPIPSGYKCETMKPKKPGSDAAPIKSAFVTTLSKPKDNTHLSRTPTEPTHTSDRYPRQGSPSKPCTRLSPSKKIYPTAKEPKQNTPGEVDDEVSTDRSSTVSSPETVKTAEDSTALDAAEFVNNKVTSQKITAASHKRTEMYIPQLTCDKGSPPSGAAQDDKSFSLSTATKTDEIAATVTLSVTLDSEAQEDIPESQHQEGYYNQNYIVEDIRDETPPDEFPVEDDSPYESPVQPYSTSWKAQKFPENVGSVQQTIIASKSKMKENTSTCKYDRTTSVTTKISQKPSAINQSRRQKQEPHSPGKEKTSAPTLLSKSRPRIATTTDVKITRSSSDKNVTRKETPSPGSVKPRRPTSKPEKTDSRATITRNMSSTRQPQVTAAGTATTIRTTKIPTQSVKPAVTKVVYTTEQKRSKDMSKSTVTTAARNRTLDKNQKVEIRNIKETKEKLANGTVQKPQTSSSSSSSSEDEDELLKTVTLDEKETALIDVSDEDDQTYIRELDEIRRTDEEQYASKITEVRTLEERLLSPSQNISGVIIQPLRSSRESSPEYPRGTVDNVNKPRYADRISEPEDDDELPRQYKQKNIFQKPTIHPESVDEEYTNDDSKPKTERLVESSQAKESPRYTVPCAEQDTDLFDKSETEQAPKSVSVADRISHFLETTRNVLSSVVPSEPGKPTESSPTPLDSPNTVRRARAMFETIAISQTTPHKDFTQIKDAEAHRDSPKESTLPGSRKPENQRRPRYTSPFTDEQFPDRQDTFSTTTGTKCSVKKSLINEYPIDEGKDSPYYKESYPVRISEDAEKPRAPSADTRIHHKSPSPERLGSGKPAYTQPRSKSPVSTFPHDKTSATTDSPVNRNYNTYTKVKPFKDITPGTKPVVSEPGTSPTVYGIKTTDAPLVDKSPHKDYPIKEFSRRDFSEHKESLLTMNDSELTSGERIDSKQEGSFSTRDESKPREAEGKDIHPSKKSLHEDFPEDTLIRTFTKDTSTQRETLRQKDIVNRPSVFEARRLGHKVTPSKRQEEFKHSYESKTSGYPEIHPSKDDMPTSDDVNYSIDTLTKASPTRKKSYPQGESPREGSPERKHPSPKDTSPTRKDPCPKLESPRVSSPTKKHPSPKDASPTSKDSHPNVGTPRDGSSTRKRSSSKDTSATAKDSYQKVESPTRKHPSPKDTSPKRKDSYPKAESPRDSSPTSKHYSPKDTSPKRKDSYPKAESPRDSSPSRKHPSPKDTSPTRKDSYPKAESPRDSSPTSKHYSPKDTSPTRKDSYSSRVTCNVSSATMQRSSSKDESPRRKGSSPVNETPREFFPTREYTVPTDTSPAGDESRPSLKDKITDNRHSTDSSHISQDIVPKRISLTRPETKPGTTRKDSQNNQYSPKQETKPLETGTVRSSGRFGVNLRRTGSTVGSTIQRRLSGESSKKGDETRIEDIFDLELLESMLEKAVGYEQRRSIRAQIRIVRRLLAERSAVTVKSEGKPEQLIGGVVTHFVDKSQDGGFDRHQDETVETKMSSTRQEIGGPDDVSFDRRPGDDDTDDSYQKPSSVSQKPCPKTREGAIPDVQDSKPPASRSESYSTFPRDSKPAPEKIPDRKSSPARKSSKSELNVELKPAAPSPVKSPIKKSSLGELPREAFPTDSVTSSYGVGPTDENGHPLFGLSALRRRQSANSNIQIPQDAADSAPASELEPEDKPQEVESKPTEICDSSGRPFFGGLRALKATTTTTSKGSSTPQDGDKAPSTESTDVREQRVSSHLRELVTKHEQTSRGNAISQPTAPRQKPRAKLRDSFIQHSQDSESEKQSAEELTDARVISQRVNSLRAIIQKHEKIAQDETRNDRVPSSDGDIPDAGDTDISCRPGILKKAHGSDQVVTESTSTSSTTVISSRGILKSDGTVSLKRDIIQGETVSRLGEEPVTRITRTQYSYSTPEDKSTVASSYDCDHSDSTRKSSTSSRRSSSGKTPSPERGHLDSDVKLTRITTSGVTSSNSFRRSKVSEEDRSKYDKIRSTATHDDVSRGSKVTTERKSEEDEKFLSSATAFLPQQKMTDENSGILSSSSLERESISKTENETRFSTVRDGKYTSSTTATITQTTPVSVHDDFDDTRKTSASGYGNYSSTTFSRSEAGKEVTSYLLDSERSRCSSESRRLQHSNDDDERDGYQHVPRTVTESDSPRASRRYSIEADADAQVQRSEVSYSTSSSVTQNHSAVTTTVETTTSRSSTPKQIIESVRRRSSATSDIDRDASPAPSAGSSGFSRVARGGSVRALSEKFQKAAAEANSGDSTHSQRSYPKAGLIFRSSSFRLNNCTSPATTPTREEAPESVNLKQSVYEDMHSVSTPTGTCRTPSAETEGKSFLTNQTHVTGVQDVITRMKNADQDVKAGDSEDNAEARSLLNKFLGAQVMLQGMDPLVKASQSQSAALVSQVERQRVLASQKTATALTSHKDSEQDLEEIWDEKLLRELLDKCSDYEGRRKIRARLRVVMAEQKACASVVAAALADEKTASEREQVETGDVLHHSIEEGHSESKVTSSSTDGSTVTHTEVTTKTSSISATSVGKGRVPKAPSGKAMSPFAKFQQLDRQSSSQSTPSSPKTPGGTTAAPLFKFTDPQLSRSASGVKDRLLFWCQCKTKEYKNIQIDNFSTSWSNGLAFCALIHHFLPDAFEYDSLRPEERRKNFELAFRVADEKAGIAPLLDVEDMVIMHKPDWKCVFTYVQSVYRRFKDQD